MVRNILSLVVFLAAALAPPRTFCDDIFPGQIEVKKNFRPDIGWAWPSFVCARPNGEIWIPAGLPARGIHRYDSNLVQLPSINIDLVARAPALNLPDGGLLLNLLPDSSGPAELHVFPPSGPLKRIPTDGPVHAAAVQSDGKILIAGQFSRIDGSIRNCIARLNANLTVDSSFNIGIGPWGTYPARIDAVVSEPDGTIYIGGQFSYIGVEQRFGLARLHPTGELDLTFNAKDATYSTQSPFGAIPFLIVSGDRLYVVASPYKFIRLYLDGERDYDWIAPFSNTVAAIKKQRDGKLLVAGGTTQNRLYLIRLRQDGSPDRLFRNFPTNYWVSFMDLDSLDRPIVSGEVIGGNPMSFTARLASDRTAHIESFVLALKTPRTVEIIAPAGLEAVVEHSSDFESWSVLGKAVIVDGRASLEVPASSGPNIFFRGLIQ